MFYPDIISKIRDNKVHNMEENERPQVFFYLKRSKYCDNKRSSNTISCLHYAMINAAPIIVFLN